MLLRQARKALRDASSIAMACIMPASALTVSHLAYGQGYGAPFPNRSGSRGPSLTIVAFGPLVLSKRYGCSANHRMN